MVRKKRTHRDRRAHHGDPAAQIEVKGEDDLLEIVRSLSSPALILVLDSIQDPHNLGACLRVADAAGVDAVVSPRDRAVSITPTVRQVASGAAEHIPFVRVTNLVRTIGQLKEAGTWIVGTSDSASQSIYEMDLKGPTALVMGSEGKGLRRLVEEKCDFLARIPMRGSVECLNVSVAAGVCLFEAVRQRLKQS
ncbi:MAG: 23S rRNA (guanosine(2251)-2'-O)-methyltransferase RlmB [Candidatus Zixiibacteriota bacterium]|nr:MAG: 23S rRNA (guanosine(2251)-2'-O)-methyltransferase RlmB [candidate division Zixibacteria bacterium]